MSSIFLSYKRDADAERVSVVRTKLEALGLDIFQDVDMSAGSYFPDVLKERIGASTAVLVLWTKSSLKSRWVLDEALRGLKADKLVAVTFDGIVPLDLPMPFGSVQTPDLSDWIETGARMGTPSWRSVLKALGVLFKRPLLEIAAIVETPTAGLKAAFVRKYPDDPFSAGLTAELKAAKLDEFQKQSTEAKQLSEARLADEVRRLDQLGTEFAGLVDVALTNGTLETLDAKQIIQRTLRDSADTDRADDGSDEGRAASEQIARMQSEIDELRASKNAAERAKAEIAGTAAQLNSQLDGSKRELLDLQNRFAETKASAEGRKPGPQDFEKKQWQRSVVPWLAPVFGALLGAGVIWIFFEPDSLGKDNKQLADQLSETKTKLADRATTLEALGREKEQIATQLKEVTTELAEAKDTVDTLKQNNKALSDRADETARQLAAATTAKEALGKEKEKLIAALSDVSTKVAEANATSDTLRKNNKALSDRADESAKNLVTATTAKEVLGKENEKLSADLKDKTTKLADMSTAADALKQNYKALSDQLTESGKKVDAANSKITSISQELAKYQQAEGIRVASEVRCDELAAYETDADLPSYRKPATKTPSSNAQEVIEKCSAALSSLPKQTSRRLLLQLSRGYIMQGHPFRQNDPASANSQYSTAVSVATLASSLGSRQADEVLGYILNGGFNVPKFNYVFPGTPNYAHAWERFRAAASEGNAYGLLYAGSFLLWPGCSQNSNLVPNDPDTGLKYLRQAQGKKIAAAYYAEGYYWYFSNIRTEVQRAAPLFEKANSLSVAGATADFASLTLPTALTKPAFPTPAKREACPSEVFR